MRVKEARGEASSRFQSIPDCHILSKELTSLGPNKSLCLQLAKVVKPHEYLTVGNIQNIEEVLMAVGRCTPSLYNIRVSNMLFKNTLFPFKQTQ